MHKVLFFHRTKLVTTGDEDDDERGGDATEAFLAPKGLGNGKAFDCQAKSSKAASDSDDLDMVCVFFVMRILVGY